MKFEGKLKCGPSSDIKEVSKHLSAVAVAFALFSDYLESVNDIEGQGPEMYAEFWMEHMLEKDESNTEEFRNLVIEYFVDMLFGFSRNSENGGQHS